MSDKVASMTLAEAVDLYLSDVSRRCSPNTYRKYEQCLDTSRKSFLNTMGKNYPVKSVTSKDCLQWLGKWASAKPKTQALHDTALREMFKFLVGMDYIEPNDNPMLKIRKVRVPSVEDRDVKMISADEVQRVIGACRTWTEMLTIGVLAFTGVRRQAANNLKWKDVNLGTGYIKFHEKGAKTISKPIPALLANLLMQAKRSELSTGPDDYVIPSVGTTRRDTRHAHFLWKVVKAVCERAGVDAYCHSFRSAFAVHYLTTHEGDLEALQALMGHKHLATTQGYLRLFDRGEAMERVRDLDYGVNFNGALSEGGHEKARHWENFQETVGVHPPSLSALTEGVSPTEHEAHGTVPSRAPSPSVSASSEPLYPSPADGSPVGSDGVLWAARSASEELRDSNSRRAVGGVSTSTDSVRGPSSPPQKTVRSEPTRLPSLLQAAGLGFEPRLCLPPAAMPDGAEVLTSDKPSVRITAIRSMDYLVPLTRRVEV